MKLRDCRDILQQVERDAEFSSLGFVTHQRTALLTFVSDERFVEAAIGNPEVRAVVTSADLADRIPKRLGLALCADPRRNFLLLHNHLAQNTNFYGEDRPSVISSGARVHPTAYVSATNVVLGERVVVEPHATILNRVVAEEDVIIRAGAVVGSEGFQFELTEDGMLPVIHAGSVRLCRGAEIQSNACVDRGVFGGETIIGEDARIDGLVFVAHDVKVGKRARIVAQSVLCGSAVIRDEAWIGPGAVVSSGVTVGRRARVSLGSVVTKDVREGTTVSGNFAIEHNAFLRFIKTIR